MSEKYRCLMLGAGAMGSLLDPRGLAAVSRSDGVRGEVAWEGQQAISAQFLDCLDAGPPSATTLADNLQSTAMLFAAIRASETGVTVNVEEMARQVSGLA
jgi:hypothetical protein